MNSGQASWIMQVGEGDFQQKVLQASKDQPVIVDFWALWCAPCRMLTPILEKVIGDQKGAVILAKVNIDEAPNLAAQFNIQGIPLVIAFRHGKPIAEFEGVRAEVYVRQFMQKLLPTESDKLADQARGLEADDPARAELTYLQALDRDRQNEAAALGLARLMLARGRPNDALPFLADLPDSEEVDRLKAMAWLRQTAASSSDADSLRQRVENNSSDAAARFQLGVVLAAAERYPEALEVLLSAAERDPKLAASSVREAMVNVFNIVGRDSSQANDYRNKLTALLY